MITQIREPEGRDPDGVEPHRMDQNQEQASPVEDGEYVSDSYAAAELLRRHERTESMIRKAHEQFL